MILSNIHFLDDVQWGRLLCGVRIDSDNENYYQSLVGYADPNGRIQSLVKKPVVDRSKQHISDELGVFLVRVIIDRKKLSMKPLLAMLRTPSHLEAYALSGEGLNVVQCSFERWNLACNRVDE